MEKKKEERKRSRSWCNDTRTHTHTSLPNITFLLPHPLLAVPRSFALIIIVFTPSFAIGFHRHPRQERSKYDNMQNFFKQTILWWESKQIDSKNHARKQNKLFFFLLFVFNCWWKRQQRTDYSCHYSHHWQISSLSRSINDPYRRSSSKLTANICSTTRRRQNPFDTIERPSCFYSFSSLIGFF